MAKTFISLVAILACFSTINASTVKVNKQLQTSLRCSSINSCALPEASCNEAGYCQCNWQYFPYSSNNNGVLDRCNTFMCNNDAACQYMYGDKNSTCNGSCVCQAGFVFNQQRQQCEYSDPKSKPLGSPCTTSSDCAGGSYCSNYGYCACSLGYVPMNNMTCARINCDSDQFCRGRVAQNSRCVKQNYQYSFCQCSDDFIQNYEFQICIPRAQKLDQSCTSFDGTIKCGYGATCADNKCKCFAGMQPKANKMDCQTIKCSTNLDCMSQDYNSECISNSCQCRDGYFINSNTQLCVKQKSFSSSLSTAWFIIIVVASATFFAIISVCISRKVHEERNRSNLNEKTPMKK